MDLDDDLLLRIYDNDSLFDPCERKETRFIDDIEEAKDLAPRGDGLFFRIVTALPHAVGNPISGGDWPASRNRKHVEGHIEGAQIASSVEFTLWLQDAQANGGSYGDADADRVTENTLATLSYADRLYGCGHKTGRLAVVGANATASDTVQLSMSLANPEGGFQLRRNMVVDIYNLDSGGTIQEADVEILDVDPFGPTPTVVFDRAVTVVAGWGIYQADVYGHPMPNGVRNIVDDGDFASTIFGLTRADDPALNAVVMDGNNALQEYSQELVRTLLDRITQGQDNIPNQLRCNNGIMNEHLRTVTPDAVYNVDGNSVPSYPTGANQEKLHFQYGDKKIPFRPDRNLPARELYALDLTVWRKATLRKLGWVKGPDGKYFHTKPADGGGTYAFACVGAQLMNRNVYVKRLNSQGKLTNIKDRTHAGDA